MNNKIIIVCETLYHGNTIKLANAMAQTLNCKVIGFEKALNSDLSKYEIIGIGSGIYFTSHHPKLVKVSQKLTPSQKAFIFSTHGAPFVCKYHNTIKSQLIKNNVSIIGEFSCKGYDCTGPFIITGGGNVGRPNERDCRKAQKFIKKILPEFCKDTSKVHTGKFVEVRENECVGCGKCVTICPMNVFEMGEGKSIPKRAIDCTHCLLCVENCPQKAISVEHSWLESIAIAKRHSKRKSL